MLASQNEILAKTMEIGMQAELRRESDLVKALVTNSAKGRGGVMGLQETLDAIREGRLQTLVIRDGFRDPGMRCTGCGYISVKSVEACPYCGSKMEQIPDAVELAVRDVMRDGGEVEVLHSDQKIKGFDKIGAILRY
jgi:peptide chain release factor subunit 1